MHLFLFEKIEGKTALLTGDEAIHCLDVLRFKPGDSIQGIDGRGTFYSGIISQTGKESVKSEIRERIESWGETSAQISLAISVLHKPDRLEWLAEKAVELGITQFVPFVGERTVKTGFRADRIEKIMISALKQCKRSRLPEIISPPIKLSSLINSSGDYELRFIPWCEAGRPLGDFSNRIEHSSSIQFIIGPEGDFTNHEIEAAEKIGIIPVSLGQTRLRAETAALHVLSVVKQIKKY